MCRERKYDSFDGVTACASFGGTGMRSERLVPVCSLPSRGRGVRRGPGGSVAAAFGHLLPPEGPSRGWRGRRQRRAGRGHCRGLPACTGGSCTSPFSRPCLPPPGRRDGSRLPTAGLSPARSLCPPLPKLSSPGSWAAQEEVRGGGGGRIGRTEVRNNKKPNKQTKTIKFQRLSRFITALS